MEEENESPSGSQGDGAVSAQKGGLVIRPPGERGCDAQGSGYRWRHRHHAHQQVVGRSDIDEGNAEIISGTGLWRQMSEVKWEKQFGRGKHEI